MGDRYFIATRKHGFVGNAVVFWRPNGAGYTCSVDDAGEYDEATAIGVVSRAPAGECRMLPVESVRRLSRAYFDDQDMHQVGGWYDDKRVGAKQ